VDGCELDAEESELKGSGELEETGEFEELEEMGEFEELEEVGELEVETSGQVVSVGGW